MPESTNEPQLEFPINQTLLEEATKAREEWRVIKDRVQKIEQSKGQVSTEVYDRVRKDYETRLGDSAINMKKKKDAVDRELASLDQTRRKIEAQLVEHRQKLEEIKFRNTLGEFTDSEYQAEARTEQDKITKFETVINAVNNNVSRYKSIFAEDTDVFVSSRKETKQKETVEVTQPKKTPPPILEVEPQTDGNGFVIEHEGPDYFSTPAHNPAHSEDTNPMIEESLTSKAAVAPAPRQAVVVIINGTEAGTTYPLRGTVTIGRAESNTIVLRDVKVSRQHSQIVQQGKEFMIIDLNSSNGTYVNNQRIEEHALSNGDEVLIGDFVLQFQN